MTLKDPIIEEIHAVRERLAQASEHDLDTIIEEARARQEAEGRTVVRFPARKPAVARKAS